MRYRLADIPYLLQNPVGRHELLLGQRHNLWPLLRRLAVFYRTLFLSKSDVIAVVGSLGKSTTMRAVSAALGLVVRGTPPTNAWSGVALSVLSTPANTPHLVLEVGISTRGSMRPHARMIRPTITIVTSIAGEHYRSLGSLEEIRSEKAEMVRCLPAEGYAILNGDDPNVMWMAEQTSASIVSYGFGKDNDVRADAYSTDWPVGSCFEVSAYGESRSVCTPLVGRHMVYPVLAAVAVGLAVGKELGMMLSGLEYLDPTPGRMETIQLDNGAIILRDDYKSTYETVFSALDTFSTIPATRRIALLGELADAPGSLGPIHREIGRVAAHSAAKILLICGRNSFRQLRAGALQAGMPRGAVIHAGRHWYEAYRVLRQELSAGDVLLIKGRRSQRLDRITLALQGHSVQCRVQSCKSSIKVCGRCPMVKQGWDGLRVTV